MDERRDLWWASPTVTLGKAVRLPLDTPFVCQYGGEIPEIQVSYEAWGELNETRDNVVLIVHPMTADCHATGEFRGEPMGWWEPLIGPGKAIDTDASFVVCPNLIGGCYGTTGPRFPAPDGEPWNQRFPLLTPRDMMRVQRLFLAELGIGRLEMVIGPSMGGMIVWEWAVEAGEAVGTAVVVAAPLVTTAYQIGMNWLQRRGIELDMTGDEVVAKLGQMIARGVGMLSYRSPTGMEEKFGRDWFKKPGKTLGERGMYNVESWLRFHGKRITKRFDPFTYLLYSRAMDLHDVSAGRGDIVAAADAIRGRVLVIGISSDFLYAPQDVHSGADLLRHLGKDVHYAEIRSLHGHDAFLLDTDQIGRILRENAEDHEHEPRVPSVRERELRFVGVGLIGAGQVAASFVRLLEERKQDLAENHGLVIQVLAAAERNPDKKLDPVFDEIPVHPDAEALLPREDLDVIVELTRSLDTREVVERAIQRRRFVVTPNKPLIRRHGDALERLAFQNGVRLAYHDSIAAGWPLLYSVERPLAAGEIVSIQAMLSTSCNVVLERIGEGIPYEEAVEEVVRRELTEVDPELDLSGWDAAQKLGILVTRSLERRHVLAESEWSGLEGLDPQLVRAAPTLGLRIKLVALARLDGDRPRATVRPMAVPAESHLGAVRGINHVIVLQTAAEGEVVQIGPGGGTLPVATAVLNDLIGLIDPEQSWTGRFPVSTEPMEGPAFASYLCLVDGRAELSDVPARSSVPLLSP